MEIKKLKVSELKQHPKNTQYFRDMIGLEWQNFLDDIGEVGVKNPIIINQNNYVVSGNQRLRACKELNIDTIDCIVRSYESEEQEISDLIRFNVIQRNLTLFDTLELINKVKQGYKSRQGTNQYTSLASSDNRTKLLTPTLQISKDFKVPKDVISLANKWEQLTPEIQDFVISKFKDKIPTQKAVSNEVNTLLRQKEYELQQLKKENESKQLTIQDLESKKKNIELDLLSKQDKLKKLSNQLDNKEFTITELKEIESKYNELQKDIVEIEDTKSKILELKNTKSELFNEMNNIKVFRESVSELLDFISPKMIKISNIQLSPSLSDKLQDTDIKPLIQCFQNFIMMLEQK